MKRVLITGGAGFIGSEAVRQAVRKGYQVLNIDALKYCSNLQNVECVQHSPMYEFVEADIADTDAMKKIFAEFRPNYVMNFAAESHVDNSISNPDIFVSSNINGTYNMLKVAYDYWKEVGPNSFRFLQVSTDEVFGSLRYGENRKFHENSRYAPSSPYSASKAASDHLVMAWAHTYGFPALISNCSNNYGRYQFPEKLIPVVIISALQKSTIPIYGNGLNIRDWLHVSDHISAIWAIIQRGVPGHSYCIGGNHEVSNIDLVKGICKIIDERFEKEDLNSFKLVEFVKDRAGHDERYAIDSTKIYKDLGWSPKINFEEGLRDTVNWYIDNREWWAGGYPV